MRHTQLVTVISSDFPGHLVPLHICCKQHCHCMIDVSALPISCSVFLLNISHIHALIINIKYADAFASSSSSSM